ncbi:MAG: hypothetical protein WBA76_17100 [Phormidesmis sp.]
MRSTACVFVLAIALSISACDQPPSEQKPLATLNVGDLQYTDKLLMQRDRATEAHKEDAAKWLKASKEMAAEDKKARAAGLPVNPTGLVKMHCPAAMAYPTNEALIACAEALLLGDIDSESRVNRFRGAANIYQATLEFSEALNEPLTAAQRQSVETNRKCLNSFLANANSPAPKCSLVFYALHSP